MKIPQKRAKFYPFIPTSKVEKNWLRTEKGEKCKKIRRSEFDSFDVHQKQKKSRLFPKMAGKSKFNDTMSDFDHFSSSLQYEPDSLRIHGGAPPVVEVVLQIAVADAELELL